MAEGKTTEVASVHEEKGHDAEWVGNGTTTLDSNATSHGGQLEVIRHHTKPPTRLVIFWND
jgi:hypothetical protein